MAYVQTVLASAGPLPVSTSFTNDSDDPLFFYVAGSAWSPAPGMLSVQLLIDGRVVDTISVFANEANSHKTLVAKIIEVPALSLGSHTISLQTTGNTIADQNDFFSVSVIEPEDAFVLNYQGPIPYYTTFQSEIEGTALVFLSGSAWSGSAGPLNLLLVINHNPVASRSTWVNEGNSHHALPPVFTLAKLSVGKSQIGFSMNDPATQTDSNDFLFATIFF